MNTLSFAQKVVCVWALFCIHVFNFRSSLRKSLFKRSSIQFLTRERQLVIARTERGIGYVSVRLTNRRKRARGSFFLWRENPPRHFAQVFWWDTWSFARSFSVIFPWKIVFSQRIQQLGETKTFLHFVHFLNFYLLQFCPIFDHFSSQRCFVMRLKY